MGVCSSWVIFRFFKDLLSFSVQNLGPGLHEGPASSRTKGDDEGDHQTRTCTTADGGGGYPPGNDSLQFAN